MNKSYCTEVGLNKRTWTALEDEILVSYINAAGEGKWTNVPKNAGLKRCGKSCRLRWLNYLRPNIKRGNISEEEEELIIRLHKLLGNRWSLIAGRLPGRTDNEIKNYWNTTLSKKAREKSFTINMQWMLKSKPQENNISSSSSPPSIPGLIRAKAFRCAKASYPCLPLQDPSSTAGVIDHQPMQISHQSFGEELMEKKEDGAELDGGDLLSFDDSLWLDGLEFEGWINGEDDGIMNEDDWGCGSMLETDVWLN